MSNYLNRYQTGSGSDVSVKIFFFTHHFLGVEYYNFLCINENFSVKKNIYSVLLGLRVEKKLNNFGTSQENVPVSDIVFSSNNPV